jgi:hypothetical protein
MFAYRDTQQSGKRLGHFGGPTEGHTSSPSVGNDDANFVGDVFPGTPTHDVTGHYMSYLTFVMTLLAKRGQPISGRFAKQVKARKKKEACRARERKYKVTRLGAKYGFKTLKRLPKSARRCDDARKVKKKLKRSRHAAVKAEAKAKFSEKISQRLANKALKGPKEPIRRFPKAYKATPPRFGIKITIPKQIQFAHVIQYEQNNIPYKTVGIKKAAENMHNLALRQQSHDMYEVARCFRFWRTEAQLPRGIHEFYERAVPRFREEKLKKRAFLGFKRGLLGARFDKVSSCVDEVNQKQGGKLVKLAFLAFRYNALVPDVVDQVGKRSREEISETHASQNSTEISSQDYYENIVEGPEMVWHSDGACLNSGSVGYVYEAYPTPDFMCRGTTQIDGKSFRLFDNYVEEELGGSDIESLGGAANIYSTPFMDGMPVYRRVLKEGNGLTSSGHSFVYVAALVAEEHVLSNMPLNEAADQVVGSWSSFKDGASEFGRHATDVINSFIEKKYLIGDTNEKILSRLEYFYLWYHDYLRIKSNMSDKGLTSHTLAELIRSLVRFYKDVSGKSFSYNLYQSSKSTFCRENFDYLIDTLTGYEVRDEAPAECYTDEDFVRILQMKTTAGQALRDKIKGKTTSKIIQEIVNGSLQHDAGQCPKTICGMDISFLSLFLSDESKSKIALAHSIFVADEAGAIPVTDSRTCDMVAEIRQEKIIEMMKRASDFIFNLVLVLLCPMNGWSLSDTRRSTLKNKWFNEFEAGQDLMTNVLECIKFFQPRLKGMVKWGSEEQTWNPLNWDYDMLLFDKKSIDKVYLEAEDVIYWAPFAGTKADNMPPWVQDEQLWFQKANKVADSLSDHISRLSHVGKPADVMPVKKVHNAVVEKITMLQLNGLNAKLRPCPITIHLLGESGIGKSTLTDILHNATIKVRGLDPKTHTKYQAVQGDSYNSGFRNSTYTFVHDDIGAIKAKYQKPGESDITQILRQSNNMTCGMNSASLEDKGKKFFTGGLLILSSNSEDMGVRDIMTHPNATFRRILRLKVTLRDQYKTAEGMLSSAKYSEEVERRRVNSEPLVPDAWEFEIQEWNQISKSYQPAADAAPVLDNGKTNIAGVLKWLSKRTVSHFSMQEKVVEGSTIIEDSAFCSDCGEFGTCACLEVDPVVGWNPFSVFKKVENAADRVPKEIEEIRKSCAEASQKVQAASEQVANHTYWVAAGVSIVSAAMVVAGIAWYLAPKDRSVDMLRQEIQGSWQERNATSERPVIPAASKTSGVQDYDSICEKYKHRAVNLTQGSLSGNAYLVSHNLAVTCKHVAANIDFSKPMDLVSSHEYGMVFNTKGYYGKVYHIEGKDISFIRIEGSLSQRAHGLTNEGCRQLMKRAAVSPAGFAGYDVHVICKDPHGNMTVNTGVIRGLKKKVLKDGQGRQYTDELIHAVMDIPIEFGNSGSVVIIHNNKAEVIYGGLVVAKEPGGIDQAKNMYFSVVSQDMIKEALDHFEASPCDQIMTTLQPVHPRYDEQKMPVELNNNSHLTGWAVQEKLRLYGEPIAFFPNMGTKSKRSNDPVIVPPYAEEAHEFFGGKYKFTTPYVGKEPWRKAITQEASCRFTVPPDFARQVTEHVASVFLKRVEQHPDGLELLQDLKVESDHVAINGLPGFDYMNGVNMSSSPGYPYSGDKKVLFEGERPNAVMTPELKQMVEDVIKAWENGESAGLIVKTSLKHEIVSFEKLAAKKNRVFSVVPFAYVHLQKRLFMRLKRLMFCCRFLFESAIGYNAHSGETGDLVDLLTQKHTGESARQIAGDFEGFDKRMDPVMLVMVFYLVYLLLSSANSGMKNDSRLMPWLRGIKEDTLNGYGTYDGNLYRRAYGMISGFYETSEFGCHYQSIAKRMIFCVCFYYAQILRKDLKDDDFWIEEFPDICDGITWDLVREADFKRCTKDALACFEDNVKMVNYGDDHVDSTLLSCPNGKIYQRLFSGLFNMGYTDANKNPQISPFEPFEIMTMLKRSFHWDQEIEDWRATLVEKSRAKGLHLRVKGSGPENEGHKGALEAFLIESSNLGREQYEKCLEFASSMASKYLPNLDVNLWSYDDHLRRLEDTNAKVKNAPQYIPVRTTIRRCDRWDRKYNSLPQQEIDDTVGTVDQVTLDTEADEASVVHGASKEVVSSVTVEKFVETRKIDSIGHVQLASFFDRPVELADLQLNDGTRVVYDPWTQYVSHGSVWSKLSGHVEVRMRLKIKAVISSSAFTAGRLFIAYDPLSTDNSVASLNQCLQVRHIEMRVDQSDCAELTIPFVWHSDFIDMRDVGKLGRLHLYTYGFNKVGEPSNPSVNISCWAEDVELKGMRAPIASFVKAPDQVVGRVNGNGFELKCRDGTLYVHDPSEEHIARMKKWPKKLSMQDAKRWVARFRNQTMPKDMTTQELGRFMSTEAFGIIESYVRDANSSSLSYADANLKQSFMRCSDLPDVLAELGIVDQVSLDNDNVEMSPDLMTFLQTESAVCDSKWETGRAQRDQFTAFAVCPSKLIYNDAPDGVNRRVDAGYMHLFSQLTRFWCGSIVFRVRVVKTIHHKGSLVFWLDRSTNNSTPFQHAEHVIIDIAKEDEFDIQVNFDSSRWLETHERLCMLRWCNYSSLACMEQSQVKVLVTARAGDDFKLSGVFPRPTHIIGASDVDYPSLSPSKDARRVGVVDQVFGRPRARVPIYELGVATTLSEESQEVVSSLSDFIYRENHLRYSVEPGGDLAVDFHRFPLCLMSGILANCHKAWKGAVRHIVSTSANTMERGRVLIETSSSRVSTSVGARAVNEYSHDAVISPINQESSFVAKHMSSKHFTLLKNEQLEDRVNRVRTTVLATVKVLCHYDVKLEPNFKFLFATAAPSLLMRGGATSLVPETVRAGSNAGASKYDVKIGR